MNEETRDKSLFVTYGESGFSIVGNAEHMTDADKMALLRTFEATRKTALETFQEMGRNVSDFYKKCTSEKLDTGGKSKEEIERVLNDMLGDYISFASGIDFSQWQKAGESLKDTVVRVVSALKAIPEIKEKISDTIFAIQNNLDPTSLDSEQVKRFDKNIGDLWDEFARLTDPGDQVAKLDQLRQALLNKYNHIIKSIDNG